MSKSKKKFDILKKIPEIDKKNKNASDTLKTIKEQKNIEEQPIKISLEFFDRTNEMFNLGNAKEKWYLSFLDTIQLLTQITKKQLFGEYKDRFKPHPYDEKDLNYKDPFLLDEQAEAYQLRINKGSGRIHGFFVENTYYIRFLDNNHNMYDSEGYGGVQYYDHPLNEFEVLQDEVHKIKEENKVLAQSIDNGLLTMCENCADCQKSSILYKNLNYK